MLHIFPPTTALRWLKHLWTLFLKEIKERTLSEKQGNSMTCIKYCQYRHIVLTSLISSCPQRLAQIIFVVHTSLYGPLDNNSLENSCLTANDANWRKKKNRTSVSRNQILWKTFRSSQWLTSSLFCRTARLSGMQWGRPGGHSAQHQLPDFSLKGLYILGLPDQIGPHGFLEQWLI